MDQSSFFSPSLFFTLQPVKYLKAGLGVLSDLCMWYNCKLTSIHEAKVLSGNLAEKILAPKLLQCHLNRVGMFHQSVCSELQRNNRSHINEISPFHSHFLSYFVSPAHTNTHMYILKRRETHSVSGSQLAPRPWARSKSCHVFMNTLLCFFYLFNKFNQKLWERCIKGFHHYCL